MTQSQTAKRGISEINVEVDEKESKKVRLTQIPDKSMYEEYNKINPYAIDMTIADWSCKTCNMFINDCRCLGS